MSEKLKEARTLLSEFKTIKSDEHKITCINWILEDIVTYLESREGENEK